MNFSQRMAVRVLIVLAGATLISAVRKRMPQDAPPDLPDWSSAPILPQPVVKTAAPLADTYVVVKSFEKGVYEAIVEGFEESIGGRVHRFDLTTGKKLGDVDFAEIERLEPKAILAVGTGALEELDARKPSAPVVFTAITKRPENTNAVAGVFLTVSIERQLDLLLAMAPKTKSIGVIFGDKADPFYDDLVRAASMRKIKVIARGAGTHREASDGVREVFPKVDAFFLAPGVGDAFEDIVLRLSLTHRKPVVGYASTQCRAGALLASELNTRSAGIQVARLTRRVVNKEVEGEAAFEPLYDHWSYVNPDVAEKIGVKIPYHVAELTEACTTEKE